MENFEKRWQAKVDEAQKESEKEEGGKIEIEKIDPEKLENPSGPEVLGDLNEELDLDREQAA